MKHEIFHGLSLDQLVEHFESLALEQDEAMLRDQLGKYNKLYWEMESVENELKSRPGDQRLKLLTLFGHANAQVRMKAAEATLAVAPEAARKMLETIATRASFRRRA